MNRHFSRKKNKAEKSGGSTWRRNIYNCRHVQESSQELNIPGGSGEAADGALVIPEVDEALAKFIGTDEIRAFGRIVFIRSASSG